MRSDAFAAIPSVTVLPLTSDLQNAPLLRLTVQPTPANGLRTASQVMIDKAITVPRARVGPVIGRMDKDDMKAVGLSLARFFDLATD